MAAQHLDELWAYRQPIEAALAVYLEQVPALLGGELSADARDAFQRLQEYSLRPAKRVRGALGACIYDVSAGTQHAEQAIQLGVVLELVHSYLLIIDDVMDESSLRRGLPTIHEVYLRDGVTRHEAEMLAVNVGLLAQHLAGLLLSRIDVPAENLRAATSWLHRNVAITGVGQLDDLRQRPATGAVGDSTVLRKYLQKTSYYTFVNPLQLGLVLGGKADTEQLQAAERFGEPAGIAFQIRDDYLSLWGADTAKLDDIREGKYTLFVDDALKHASSPEQQKLRAILGNPAASEADMRNVRGIFEATGAQKRVMAVMQSQATKADNALKTWPAIDKKLSEILHELVDYATTRKL
ncbi:MAG TPA: polyprenyl synthetase family protein [Candidatus Microsaccharimonas sp.]|nr:polyprenyl synthetase family protein [Candidatus Microsaccharimonas sp.]